MISTPYNSRKLVGRPRTAVAMQRQTLQQDICDLLAENKTQQQIAEILGISQSNISRNYRQALEFYPYKTVDHRRELALAHLDEYLDKADEILHADHPYVSEGRVVFPVVGHDEHGKPIYGDRPLQDAKVPLQAITTAVAVLKRVADTIGSDAPKRLEATTLSVKAEDLRVTQLVRTLAAENDTRAESIRSRVQQRRALPPGSPLSAPRSAQRPRTAAERRRDGSGASPARVAAWNPEALFE